MSEAKIPRNIQRFSQAIVDLVLLYISFSVSLNLERIQHLPYTATNGVGNISKFNPSSSYPALLAVVLCTALLFLGLKKLQAARPGYFRAGVIALLLFSYLIGNIAPGVATYIHNADTFHNGEQLSPALAFDHGKSLYKDIFVLHGGGEDAIVPWLSFKLFGVSIGSYYFLEGILKLLTTGVFLWVVNKLFREDAEFLLVSVWFMIGSFAAFYYVRDLPVWISVYLVYALIHSATPRPRLLAALGALSAYGLFYSLDRGVFLCALFVVMLGVSALFVRTKEGYSLRVRTAHERWRLLLPGLAGFLGAMLAGLLLLGPSSFAAFFAVSYEVAKYQGAIFNHPYPTLTQVNLAEWLPVLALIALGLVIGKAVLAERKRLTPQTLFELVLWVFGVVFFRAAAGRPDLGHVAYGSVVIFVLLFWVVSRRLRAAESPGWDRLLLVLPLLAVLFLTFRFATDYYLLPEMNQGSLSSTVTFLKSPTKPDSYWYSRRDQKIVNFVKSRTDQKGSLFVFSSEPLLYYMIGLPNPTRFYTSWYADPTTLESQMLAELKANPPSVVIYQSGVGFNDDPDFVTMEQRLPRVNAWILANYHQRQTVAGAVILEKS